ncbi:MAG: hypothetical protein LUM44_06600 [Pyrinomonadaceae bacterium]|nr:hypothetical protein [Pyrinomonadaceae bacterium]
MRQTLFGQRFIGAVLLLAILAGSFSAFAQKKTGGQTPKGKCNGGYSGIVTYNRKITTTSSGRYGSTYSRTYEYTSNIVVRDDGTTQGSIYNDYNGIGGSFNFTGKATAAMNENINDLRVSEKDDFCKLTLKGGQDKTRVRCESQFIRKVQAQGAGDVNVFLGFKGNKYKISLDNPKVDGQMNENSKSSCSGTCGKDTPLNSSRDGEVKGEKPAGTYTDEMPVNPDNINRLSGTFTRTNGDETITITWNLSRCAPPLQIAGISFDHHVFPDANNWHGVDPLSGTVDGNLVKVKAKVFNGSGETAYATVKFTEATSGEILPDGAVSVMVKAGETRDVEYEWDTNGFAWDDAQKAKSNREIKAEIEGGDALTEKIKILPKPVIMAHGLWSNAGAWAEYPTYLREAHSFAWKGYAVGADPAHGKMNTGETPGNYKATNTVYQNAQELAKQVKFAREENNAWHVDIVAHSMGGLISRQYINTFMPQVFDGKPEVSHLVMLGTPNMGSPCADTVNGLFEEFDQNEMHAMRELRPIIVRAFNTRITDKKGVKFSVLIGTFMPRTCLDESEWGDGVVPLSSAKYNNTDYRYVFRNHIELTGKEDFQGFVMPRLAIGPKKARTEQSTAQIENSVNDNFANNTGETYQKRDDYGFNKYFQKASYTKVEAQRDEKDDSQENVTTRQKVELKANESKEIEIPVRNGSSAGVVMVATPSVSATLKDANGVIVGESKGGMEAMKEMFRTIAVNKKVINGVWKLKLDNIGNQPATVFVAGLTNNGANSGFTLEAGKVNAIGTVSLTAKLTENNAPVLNAKITAKIVGQTTEIIFFDDGKHDDGMANDGVYGATVEKLGKGEYFAEATAETNNQKRNAVVLIKTGNAETVPKTSTLKGKAK